MTTLDRPWLGDPAEIVVAFDTDAAYRALVERFATARPAWHAEAACAGAELDVFFPPLGRSAREAKAVCSGCPVRVQCLDEALVDPDLDHGVRGGLSARERTRLRRDRGAA